MNVQKLITQTPLFKKGNEEVGVGKDVLKGKVIALYFSGAYCNPCQMFTPKLKTFYQHVNASIHQFEVIFISHDRSKDAYAQYFNEKMGEWLAVDYNPEWSKELRTQLGFSTIPQFMIVSHDGTIVVDDARTPLASAVDDNGNLDELFEEWKKLAQ